MRILLAHNSTYFPASGGGDKSNRLLMEALAERGHAVRAVARIERFGAEWHQQFLRELEKRGVAGEVIPPGAVRFLRNGVEVRTLTRDSRWRAYFSSELDAFQPDIIVTSTDDPAQLLFDLAVQHPARVVYLVRATIAVPFGPESSSLSQERTVKLRQADAVVGVSHYVAGYCRKEGGLDAVHVPISLLEPGQPADLGRFENPYVVMANPCAVKGIDIFLGVADALPQMQFAAVPMWGTTKQDREALQRRGNVRLVEAFDNIDDLLRLTRVMMVPSVWHEARSRMIVESMSRGVPVVASEVGGIREAMMGVDYLLPVRPVEEYKPAVDEHMVPVAVIPPQDVGPWVSAVARLYTDSTHWAQVARESRAAAMSYLANLHAGPFEALLEDLLRRPKKKTAAPPVTDRQKLLAAMLKKRAAANAWLPVQGPSPRLFCFPFAGGGTLPFRQWQLPVTVMPLLLPGRETRLQEPPLTNFSDLVAAAATALDPALAEPYAFHGHSMGAVVAFELVRELRRRGKLLPRALFVSGARAPQFRRNWTAPPEPTDEELLEQLRQLEGIPAKILENADLLRLLLPALRADTSLYRRYTYSEGEPLPVPIFAYGGAGDPNVTPAHVEAWREQTTGEFEARLFAGGHFFIDSQRETFLAALAADLKRVGLPE